MEQTVVEEIPFYVQAQMQQFDYFTVWLSICVGLIIGLICAVLLKGRG